MFESYELTESVVIPKFFPDATESDVVWEVTKDVVKEDCFIESDVEKNVKDSDDANLSP